MNADSRRAELARFLRDRRDRLRPHDVGLPAGERRRVPGLRREEVATLAGVGVTWYTMLENGTADNVSPATLRAIARALRLSPDEIDFVEELAGGERSVPPLPEASPVVLAALAAITTAPAYICTNQWDVIAWNAMMARVWAIEPPGSPPFNIVRRMFTDPAMRALHGERFPQFAHALVAMVRAGTARRLEDPVYRALHDDLIGDPVFAAAWESYAVHKAVGPIRTTIISPNVGPFTYEALTLIVPDDSGQSLIVQVPVAD